MSEGKSEWKIEWMSGERIEEKSEGRRERNVRRNSGRNCGRWFLTLRASFGTAATPEATSERRLTLITLHTTYKLAASKHLGDEEAWRKASSSWAGATP